MQKSIKLTVSDISIYNKCPRQVYYIDRGHKLNFDKSHSYIEQIILKEIAFAYHSIIECNDLHKQLEIKYSQIIENFELIYSTELENIDLDIIKSAKISVFNQLKEIGNNLNLTISEIGKNELLKITTPIEIESVLYFDKLNLTGMPHMLICINKTMYPVIIKTGKCPENGIWSNDRLILTAYLLLVEDKYKVPISNGFVIYAKFGIIRRAIIKANDRRQVLKIINRINKIKQGNLPNRKQSSFCDNCNFYDLCKKEETLFSKFFN